MGSAGRSTGPLTWVLVTGHLLVLGVQRPRRPGLFPQLHVWALSDGRQGEGSQDARVDAAASCTHRPPVGRPQTDAGGAQPEPGTPATFQDSLPRGLSAPGRGLAMLCGGRAGRAAQRPRGSWSGVCSPQGASQARPRTQPGMRG